MMQSTMRGWAVGTHLVAVADVEVDDVLGYLKGYGPPRLIYSDLPYDARIATTFRRWIGDERRVDYERLAYAFATAAAATQGYVALETGARSSGVVSDALRAAGGVVEGVAHATYDHGKGKCHVVLARFGDPPDGCRIRVEDLEGQDSWDLPGLCIERGTNRGDVVTDLCVGLGLTAVQAARHHRFFVGCELNEDRARRTVAAMVRETSKPAVATLFPTLKREE